MQLAKRKFEFGPKSSDNLNVDGAKWRKSRGKPDLNYGFGVAAPLIRKPTRRKEGRNERMQLHLRPLPK